MVLFPFWIESKQEQLTDDTLNPPDQQKVVFSFVLLGLGGGGGAGTLGSCRQLPGKLAVVWSLVWREGVLPLTSNLIILARVATPWDSLPCRFDMVLSSGPPKKQSIEYAAFGGAPFRVPSDL